MPQLIWIDVETTGLEPADNLLLEVAVIVADLADPFTAKASYQCVLPFVKQDHEYFADVVVKMHEKNGLWAECRTRAHCEKRDDAIFAMEDALLALIPEVEDREERPIWAGSTVGFDASFMRIAAPILAGRFSHRLYDVSAVKLFCQSLGMPKIPKGEAHRAMADVRESMVHAKMCAAWFRLVAVFHITYGWRPGSTRRCWVVKTAVGTYHYENTQKEALAMAVWYCRDIQEHDGLAQVVVHGRDGKIRFERTYGADPRRSKG